MPSDRFAALATELADRDRDIRKGLHDAALAAEVLRELAWQRIRAFRDVVRDRGAPHLANVEVGAVEPDEKRVPNVSFRVSRGRWEAICVCKAAGKVTLVGPFRRGKAEKPCADQPLRGEIVEAALEELLLDLIRKASER